MVNSPEDICNLAVGMLGNFNTINSIESPVSDKETVLSLWYPITRQALLKEIKPNFALKNKLVSKQSEDGNHRYTYAYEYPSDCLQVLGIGDLDEKVNDYVINANSNSIPRIYSNEDYTGGLKLRYVADVTEVSLFSPEFKILLARVLSGNVAPQITQDMDKVKMAMEIAKTAKLSAAGLNVQENRPVRIETSKFRQSRTSDVSTGREKK